MKRFLNRFGRSSVDSTVSDKAAEVPETNAAPSPSAITQTVPADGGDAPFTFELREPTEEELNASFLSKQDFLDLDRVMPTAAGRAGAPSRVPTIVSVAPVKPVVAPPTAPPVRVMSTPVQENISPALPSPTSSTAAPSLPTERPHPAKPADPAKEQRIGDISTPATIPVSTIIGDARPTMPTPSGNAPPLIGFWDGLAVGESFFGWVGNPTDETCRAIQVTAFVDGSPVASTIANIARNDTPHAGFRLIFTDSRAAQLVLEDRIVLRATYAGFAPTDILPLPSVLSIARAHRTRELERQGLIVGELAPVPRAVSDLSLFRLPVGLQSPNAAAIIGKEGFLFAHRGEHDIIGLYNDRANPQIDTDASQWLALFQARNSALADRKIAYVQSIVPEKATILHALTPPGSHMITARLGLIEARVGDEIRADETRTRYYRSLVAALRSCHAAGIAPFLRLDDQLRTIGAQLSFYQLVQHLAGLVDGKTEQFGAIAALCGQVAAASRESAPFSGSLARHYSFPMYETELVPDLTAVETLSASAAIQTNSGSYQHRIWQNPAAPSDLRILAFGQFGSGENNRTISWWFKSLFREFSLVESTELDLALIDRWQPHAVLCLSTERELRNIPAR